MTWEVTQWERSDLARERGRERKAAIMWRVNALAVGEWSRLRQREGEEGGEKKRKRGRSSLCSLPVETQGGMKEGWKKREWKVRHIPPFPPPPVSQEGRCEVTAQTQPKVT